MKISFLRHVFVAALVGCGGGAGATTSPAGEAGLYTLRSIDGVSLPTTIINQPSLRMTVLSGQFILSGGQVTGIVVTRIEATGSSTLTQTTTSVGTYTLSGSALSMRTTSTTNGVSSQVTTGGGTLSGSGMITAQSTDGKTYVYQR